MYAITALLPLAAEAYKISVVSGAPPPSGKPLFAFAGQSNMVGYSTEGSSSDTTQFQAILDIIQDYRLTDAEKEAQLEAKFLEAEEAKRYPEASAFQAQYMLQLQDRGLLQDIETALPNAYCSLSMPDYDSVNATNVSPTSKCGGEFGSELMFAHSFSNIEPWNSTDFVVSKIVKDGSEIYNNWTSPNANAWETLNKTIHSAEGTWRAFVWHQGENDCFINEDGEDTSFTYESNLTMLIDRVRTEMHRATPYYPSADDIPVVIVKIHWPLGEAMVDRYNRVVQAQKRVADVDPRAAFVDTSDLKGFYHLNAGSLFVVGDRIAQQLAPLLSEETEPSPLPTTTSKVSARWSGCADRLCHFIISNSHDSDVYLITHMDISWPLSPVTQTLPRLHRVKQGDSSIWKERSQTSPTMIASWNGEEVNREVAPSSERQYKFKFENNTLVDEDTKKYRLVLTLENTSSNETTLLIL